MKMKLIKCHYSYTDVYERNENSDNFEMCELWGTQRMPRMILTGTKCCITYIWFAKNEITLSRHLSSGVCIICFYAHVHVSWEGMRWGACYVHYKTFIKTLDTLTPFVFSAIYSLVFKGFVETIEKIFRFLENITGNVKVIFA